MTSPSPYSWQHPSAPPPLDPQIVEFMRLMGAEGARYTLRFRNLSDLHAARVRFAALAPLGAEARRDRKSVV